MIRSVARRWESVVGDWRLGINSRRDTPFPHARRRDLPVGKNLDARGFEPLSHRAMGEAVRAMRLRADDVVVVYGSGKGRAVCHFARRPISKVIGIEIDRDLCDVAIANAARLRRRRAEIEIRNEDAAIANVEEATACFLFNPFGPKTLVDVLGNLQAAARHHSEPLRIVYVNARHREVVDDCEWLRLTHSHVRHRNPVTVYESLPWRDI